MTRDGLFLARAKVCGEIVPEQGAISERIEPNALRIHADFVLLLSS